MFQAAAWLIQTYYALVHNYAIAIAMVAVTVMLLITPLTLMQTKSMLEMQKVQPEMRRLQQQYRGDRTKLNEEMMKLYQEHKVNPLASCLPLAAQIPVFFIMFRVLHSLTRLVTCAPANDLPDVCKQAIAENKASLGDVIFNPGYISKTSELYQSLLGQNKMVAFGLDLAASPKDAIRLEGFPGGLPYALLVVGLALLYWVQQRMVASRTVSPTMSPTQQKVLQYLPVAFAAFQVFLPTAMVVYYMTQAVFRIGQQGYITRRFYRGEESLGRQAQAASAKAREIAAADKDGKTTGKAAPAKANPKTNPKANAKTMDATTKGAPDRPAKPTPKAKPSGGGRTTPPKNRPTPSSNRPTPSSSKPQRPKPPRPSS